MASALMKPESLEDWIKWGLLIKSWAMERDLFNDGKPLPARPTNLDDFVKALEAKDINMTISPEVTQFSLMETPENMIVVKLPPKNFLTASHDALGNAKEYELPPFYLTSFGVSSFDIHVLSKEEFHACRIGDYTLSTCA